MRYRYTITAIVLFVFFNVPLLLHGQSCCEDDTDNLETKLCYLSAKNYCNNMQANCTGYSLDGNWMKTGLMKKLQSPENFGPGGIAPCNLVLQKIDTIESVQTIIDCGCDIFFIPVVSVNPETNQVMITSSFIPQAIIKPIKEWSTLCRENLVIVFQGESKHWGYQLIDSNLNPNLPTPNTSLNNIFEGPFGSLSQFNQEGGYQAVFFQTPSTGFEVLATDSHGDVSIALDSATHDIIIADVGIFCSGLTGTVSFGSQVVTDNDILACNIFALSCQLAADTRMVHQVIELCPGESTTLSNGQTVSMPGIYPPDTLMDINGCDSMILSTEIVPKTIPTTLITYEGCEGDNFSVMSNGQLYNEFNPSGQELITTDNGCDSLIGISLQYHAQRSSMIDIIQCPSDEPFVLSNGTVLSKDGSYVDTFYGAGNFGCDSLVYIDFSIPKPDVNIQIDPLVRMSSCNQSPFNNTIPDEYQIFWEESANLSCSDCPNPLIQGGCLDQYHLLLIDEDECSWNFEISVNYDYQIYIPNTFSPNGDGINDRYALGLPPNCTDNGTFEIKIFDRWGGERYASKDLFFQWDGLEKHQLLDPGIYTYWIQYNCTLYKGDITLIR